MISKGRRQNLQLQVFQGHTLKRERSPPGVRNKSDQSWIKQYRPNVCTAQVFFRKTSSLGVMILGSGGFGMWSDNKGSLHEGNVHPYKGSSQETAFTPFFQERLQQKDGCF